MIGSWSNRIIEESRCHMRDRHALDKSNRDVNYVALGLAAAHNRLDALLGTLTT
jgi:hypothetical protein